MAAQETIEQRLQALGITLPEPLKAPPGVKLPFSFVRIHGSRAYISGHGPLNMDGTIVTPGGKLGKEFTIEQGYQSARLVALAILSSLKRELGVLDRVSTWLRVFGMVNSAPGFNQQPQVINGFSDLITDGEHGIERCQRLLKNHGDMVAPDCLHLVFIKIKQVLAVK